MAGIQGEIEEHYGKWCCIEEVMMEASKSLPAKDFVAFMKSFSTALSRLDPEHLVDMDILYAKFDEAMLIAYDGCPDQEV